MSARKLVVEQALVHRTLQELRHRIWFRTERFALWLAERQPVELRVREMYVPRYEASSDYFHVHRPAMAELMAHLGRTGLMIAAQLHTHPAEAFHSAADDKWAIVRHTGAISIVIPNFGKHTSTANFLQEAKFFSLSRHNAWLELSETELPHRLEIRK